MPVQVACRVLGVAESGYYAQRNRPPSERAIRHEWLTGVIAEVHAASHGRYGVRRVHAELTMGRGIPVGHQQIEFLMRRAGLRGLTGRRKWRRILPDQIATDLVQRGFTRQEPNRLWVTDLTEHRTREGKLFCCVVLDTFSRRVVGWSIDSSPTAALATNALGMAIDTRLGSNSAPGTIIHSDYAEVFVKPRNLVLARSAADQWGFLALTFWVIGGCRAPGACRQAASLLPLGRSRVWRR
nr:IS3 family transposase [Nesterenkonia salmonea]